MQKISLPRSITSVAILALGSTAAFLAGGFVAEGRSKEKHCGNIVFQNAKPTKEIKHHVLFSHDLHLAEGVDCKDCHNGKVFSKEKKLGINKFTMKDITRGKACGACHDGITKAKNGERIFSPTKNCSRCHNIKWRGSNLR